MIGGFFFPLTPRPLPVLGPCVLLFTHMGMLTPEDVKLIGEELGNVIEQNITPQFEEIRDEMRKGFGSVNARLDRVDGKVNVLTNVLLEKRVITEDDKRRVMS